MSQLAPITSANQTSEIALLPWVIFVALECGALAIFWAFEALPFMDLPAHAGIIAIRTSYSRSEFFQHYFVVAPHFGANSLFRFLGDSLSRWMSPVDAVRTLASLPAVALPAAVLYARHRLYNDVRPFFAYVALILSFGFMTIMGFASYMLAMAIFIVAFAEWLLLLAAADARLKSGTLEIKVALLSVLLFVSHGFSFVIFVFLAAVTCLSADPSKARLLRLRVFLPAGLLICYAILSEHADAYAGAPTASFLPRFQGLADKLSLFATPTLTTRAGLDILIGILIWLGVILAVSKSWRNSRRESAPSVKKNHIHALSIASIATLCVFAALPHSIGWFGFVDGRVLPLTLLVGLLAIDPGVFSQRLQSMATAAAGLGAAIIIALVFTASYKFQDEASGYKEVLANIPENSSLLYLPLEPDSRMLVGHPFIHYDKLVLTQRPVIPSDLWFHQGSSIYPTKVNPILRLPSEYSSSNLQAIIWDHYKLEDWNYVLIRLDKNSPPPKIPDALYFVMHLGGWWLYRTSTQLPSAFPTSR